MPTSTDVTANSRTWTVSRRAVSVPTIRHEVASLLQAWNRPSGTVDDALLLITELVTNAVQHADGPHITCNVSLRDDVLTLSVINTVANALSSNIPHPRQPEAVEESGRGLGIVTALAADWGTHLTSDSRKVWASLAA